MPFLFFIYVTCLFINSAVLAKEKSADEATLDQAEYIEALNPARLLEGKKQISNSQSQVNLTAGFSNMLSHTYLTNPDLLAQRAALKSEFENIAQALSGWRPTITSSAGIEYTDVENNGGSGSFTDPSFNDSEGDNTSKTIALSLSQPLYQGGETSANVNAAEYFVQSSIFNLYNAEQNTLFEAARSYLDVIRDRALLKLTQNNQNLIEEQLKATKARFDVGELTLTDVSQAEARLARAESDIASAKADLKASEASYKRFSGDMPPEDITTPEFNFGFPNDLEEAVRLAHKNNNRILAALSRDKASEEEVDARFAALLPDLFLNTGVSKIYDPQSGIFDETDSFNIGMTASFPLYEAGASRSRIRQAKYVANQTKMDILSIRRSVRQDVVDAWEDLQSAKAETISRQEQVKASETAREGVYAENEVGERTILDTLDADQELLDARVSLVTAERNTLVAELALALSLSFLTPEKLGFEASKTDYSNEIRKVRNNFFGIGVDREGDKR